MSVYLPQPSAVQYDPWIVLPQMVERELLQGWSFDFGLQVLSRKGEAMTRKGEAMAILFHHSVSLKDIYGSVTKGCICIFACFQIKTGCGINDKIVDSREMAALVNGPTKSGLLYYTFDQWRGLRMWCRRAITDTQCSMWAMEAIDGQEVVQIFDSLKRDWRKARQGHLE